MESSSSTESVMDVDSPRTELMETVGDEDYFNDLTDSLILTNLPSAIFIDEEARNQLEDILKDYDPDVKMLYFKSFRRARVTFSTNWKAAYARIHLGRLAVCGADIGCFMAQPRMLLKKAEEPEDDGSSHLKPPKPTKQFLISPPASPPVDWEQTHEAEPLVNYDLLRAVSELAPGEAHELHPPSEDQPGIVVHICKETKDEKEETPKGSIVQTRCPDRGS